MRRVETAVAVVIGLEAFGSAFYGLSRWSNYEIYSNKAPSEITDADRLLGALPFLIVSLCLSLASFAALGSPERTSKMFKVINPISLVLAAVFNLAAVAISLQDASEDGWSWFSLDLVIYTSVITGLVVILWWRTRPTTT